MLTLVAFFEDDDDECGVNAYHFIIFEDCFGAN